MNPNVLLIDDSLSVRVSLQHALTAAGFNVTACDSGASGRKALRTGPYALLLIDVHLPSATSRTVSKGSTRAQPIILENPSPPPSL
ncbi:MAG: response regulator [Polyangiaceae bacterium]|nr:response regulator [Polyangiaceae bacterium]